MTDDSSISDDDIPNVRIVYIIECVAMVNYAQFSCNSLYRLLFREIWLLSQICVHENVSIKRKYCGSGDISAYFEDIR